MVTPAALRALLKKRKIRQADITRSTGIMPQMISDFMRGRVKRLSKESELAIREAFPDVGAP
jgi:transcriptional regulator with XRE-family HTH domain